VLEPHPLKDIIWKGRVKIVLARVVLVYVAGLATQGSSCEVSNFKCEQMLVSKISPNFICVCVPAIGCPGMPSLVKVHPVNFSSKESSGGSLYTSQYFLVCP